MNTICEPEADLDKVSLSRLAGKSTGLPTKALAAAVLIGFSGAGLGNWHSNDPVPSSVAVVSETGKQLTRTNGSPDSAQSAEEPPAVVNVKPAIVQNPTTKSSSAPVAPSDNKFQTSPVDETVERARLSLSRGQYRQTLAALDTLSPVPGHRADFWLMKGSAHLGLGQLEPAEQAFASAQPLAPRNTEIALQRAVLKQEKGDHISALRILEDAAARRPNVPEVFLNQGYSQQELGAVREAGHSFRIFLRLTEGRSLYTGQRKVVNEWLAQFNPARH